MMRLNRTSVWKVMAIWISHDPLLFIFEHLDISWASHIHPSQKLWPFEFAESFHVQFQSSWYIMRQNQHPSEMLWPFEFLENFLCSFSSVSINHGTHTYTRVKTYGRLNMSRAYVFNFECIDILWAGIGDPSEKLWPFEFLDSFHASFSSFSKYRGPHTYIQDKVMAVWVFWELSCKILTISIYYAPESTSERNVMTIWITWELSLFII